MDKLHFLSARGFVAAGAHAGIKTTSALDVGLLICPSAATAAAAFTTNKVFAAPVKVGREHVAGGKIRGIVVNSGNANACTGRQGEADARRMCQLAAAVADCSPRQILPSSTGIIGHPLEMDKIRRGIELAGTRLGDTPRHSLQFTDAIMTTDRRRKFAAAQFKIGREKVTLTGVCKGSGMIGPRLALDRPAALHATMLAYLLTDAAVSPGLLRTFLAPAVEASFNAVTVDDHTSTNDTAVLLASGLSGARIDSRRSRALFSAALDEVCRSLAWQIAADGEGATKVVRVDVRGAQSEADAKAMARAIANSPLVKCAMNGNDPNWGRIISAAGLCGAAFDPAKALLKLQGTMVFRSGQPVAFDVAKASRSLRAAEVVVDLFCRLGKSAATVWTCDLSKEYVTINADYHT